MSFKKLVHFCVSHLSQAALALILLMGFTHTASAQCLFGFGNCASENAQGPEATCVDRDAEIRFLSARLDALEAEKARAEATAVAFAEAMRSLTAEMAGIGSLIKGLNDATKKVETAVKSTVAHTYAETCRSCTVHDNKLTCECKGGGGYEYPTLDLSTCSGRIMNSYGKLVCLP